MLDFTLENISSEEVERLRAVYAPLAESVRELIDATVRTEMDADGVAAAKAEIDSATARLRQKQTDGSLGVRYLASGERMAWGNAVGHLADDEGITVEAEGVFIQPRWARNGSE